MMYGKNKLKIRGELISDGIIRKFEEYSPIAKSINNMSNTLKTLFAVGTLYFFIMCIIQKYPLASLLFCIIIPLIVLFYLVRKSAKVLYLSSKLIGGKYPTNLFHLNKNLEIISYNLKNMQKEEFKLLKLILKSNNINNIDSIKELRNYYISISKFNKKEINIKDFIKNALSLYIIPITFGIISIYTTIDIGLSVETDIINIAYIIFTALIILSFILIIYLIFGIKKLSATNYYVLPRLEKLLLEIILNKSIDRRKKYEKKQTSKKTYEKISYKRGRSYNNRFN